MSPITDFQKIGVGLAGFGIACMYLGTMFFFNSSLLAFGNISFLLGLSFVFGLKRTYEFVLQRDNLKATGLTIVGIFIVLLGWPVIGMCVEIYGLYLLLRCFSPVVMNYLKTVLATLLILFLTIKKFFKSILSYVIGFFQKCISRAITALKGLTTTAITALKGLTTRAITALKGLTTRAITALKGLTTRAITALKGLTTRAMSLIGLTRGAMSLIGLATGAMSLIGWPAIGMCACGLCLVGLIAYFSPAVRDFLRREPVIGRLLNLPDNIPIFREGQAFVIRLEGTVRLFFQQHKLRTIGFIIAGIFIVLLGWRVIGTCVIIYGFFLLFGH